MLARLPVSQLEPALRLPSGADELTLAEAAGSPVARALVFLTALSPDVDWAALTVTDFEVLLLRLRERLLGEVCDLAFDCPACGARVEVSFHIADFLAGVRSRWPAGVAPDAERPGWYRQDEVAFRLPTAGDQAEVWGRADAAVRLLALCTDGGRVPARTRGRIERAMAAMAPEVSRALQGTCPDCGDAVEAALHVTRLVVSELTREAAGLYDDVDAIAHAYRWREADILALPGRRRRAYVDRIRRAA